MLDLLNEKQHTSSQFDHDAERIINHTFDQEKELRREDESVFKEYKKYNKNRENTTRRVTQTVFTNS